MQLGNCGLRLVFDCSLRFVVRIHPVAHAGIKRVRDRTRDATAIIPAPLASAGPLTTSNNADLEQPLDTSARSPSAIETTPTAKRVRSYRERDEVLKSESSPSVRSSTIGSKHPGTASTGAANC
jgi:hypothetical protein